MNGVEKIREASRYTAARLVNCLGTGILPYLPRLISALLTECDMGELTDFLPFTGLVVHKFRPEIFPIINDLLWPLISRVFLFLNRTATGTDEAVGLMELRKSYLTLIISLFNADVEGIFISERNVSHLNTILHSILHYTKADMDYENQTQKAAFGILLRMVDAWAGREEAGAEVPVVTPAKTAGGGGKGPTQRLPGFEQFLYESVTPVCFQVVMNPGFNFGDGQSLLIVSEITNVLRKVYERRGEEFVQFLSQVYLPSIQCPVMLIEVGSPSVPVCVHAQPTPYSPETIT
jgi:exportin-T